MADGGQEPSMEDILSSIKRIIAEDSDATLSRSRARRSVAPARSEQMMTASKVGDHDDVLELTDPVAADAPAEAETRAEPQTQPVMQAAAATPPPTAAQVHAMTNARPTVEIRRAPEANVPIPPRVEVPVRADAATVSPSTVEASRSSLAALSALVVKPDVAGSDSLEGLVREMLKPMITQWLDARLPEIVERLVAEEVRRITDRG